MGTLQQRCSSLTSSHSATMSETMMRHLLGSDKKLVHDPGPKGESGEGDACLVMVFLVITAAIGILIYEKFFRPASEDKSEEDMIEEQKAKAAEEGVENVSDGMTDEERRDAMRQAKWLTPSNDDPRIKAALTLAVFFCIWVFLLSLSLMGTGFKLLGGKDSAKMFDVADNPISALLIGVLATVLVQSSSTTTSIIVSMVHFSNPDDLRRGFAAATVHDMFNMLNVLVMLPLNWIYPFLQKMTYEMAKDQEPCEGDK